MEKMLVFAALQLVQAGLLQMLDGAALRSLYERGIAGLRPESATDLLALAADLLVSGTWIGKLGDLGSVLLSLLEGVNDLPLGLLCLQWLLLFLWFGAERVMLARKLERIESAGTVPKR